MTTPKLTELQKQKYTNPRRRIKYTGVTPVAYYEAGEGKNLDFSHRSDAEIKLLMRRGTIAPMPKVGK